MRLLCYKAQYSTPDVFYLRKYCLLLVLYGGEYSVLLEWAKCSLFMLPYGLACFVEQARSSTAFSSGHVDIWYKQ